MLIQQEGVQQFLFYAIGRCGTMKMMRATDFNIQKRFFNRATNNVGVHFVKLKHPFIQRARFVSTEEGGFGVISQLDSFKFERHGKYGGALQVYFHVHHVARILFESFVWWGTLVEIHLNSLSTKFSNQTHMVKICKVVKLFHLSFKFATMDDNFCQIIPFIL